MHTKKFRESPQRETIRSTSAAEEALYREQLFKKRPSTRGKSREEIERESRGKLGQQPGGPLKSRERVRQEIESTRSAVSQA